MQKTKRGHLGQKALFRGKPSFRNSYLCVERRGYVHGGAMTFASSRPEDAGGTCNPWCVAHLGWPLLGFGGIWWDYVDSRLQPYASKKVALKAGRHGIWRGECA